MKQDSLNKIKAQRDELIAEQQKQTQEKHLLMQQRDKAIAKMERAK